VNWFCFTATVHWDRGWKDKEFFLNRKYK
jgi:hypothetical protein